MEFKPIEIQMLQYRYLSCQICNKEFMCLNKDIKNCWCFKVEHKLIHEDLKDCICPKCLDENQV